MYTTYVYNCDHNHSRFKLVKCLLLVLLIKTNKLTKIKFHYSVPEPDYPSITAYSPSAKLPASSRFWFQDQELKMLTNSDRGKIYGNKLLVRVSSVPHPDNFNRNDKGESELEIVSNPARYYLHGAHFEKIKPPTCRLTSCHGPHPNDGSLLINKGKGNSNEECEQIFVQMNGCVAQKGYPIGMVCTICCQCTKQFVNEMSHSRGFLTNDWLTRERFTFI
uniref:ADAM_spacer1 domain-containing protein n=1 Tax=Elaeophora elaphi TaxID=1147741 RepID=A0A0R3RQ11_9BILA